jgi:putative transcriptional regulator
MSGKLTRSSAKQAVPRAPKRGVHQHRDEFSAADLKAMRRVSAVKKLRWKLGLSQPAFARRYGIPLGTLRDWEQGRSAGPTGGLASYLKVIAADPTVERHVKRVRELA